MDSITFWKGAICLATLASFMQAALALATSNLPLWKASPFTFLLASRAATMSWYFQPTSCPSLPREQNHLPCRGNDHQLLFVIGRGNTLEGLEPLQSVLAALSLVGGHATHSAPEDLGWSPEVERSTGGLHVAALLQEVEVLQLVAVEVSAHVDAFAPDNDDLVASEDELGNDGGEPAHQVATTVHHDCLRRYARHLLL